MSKTQETRPATVQSGWPFLPSLQAEFAQFLDRFDGLRSEFGPRLVPAIDMSETEDGVEITAEVPGLSADEIEASIVQDRLVLQGGHDEEREEKGKDWHVMERRTGSFRRVVPLGFTPGEGDMEAKLADGVLRVKIAKPSDAKATAKKIKIDAA